MKARTFLTDLLAPVVADTSTAINLIATECAPEIIRSLPVRIVAVDVVPAELELGRVRGRTDADKFNALVTAGLVEIVQLGEDGERYFESLVVGTAAETLDDGEAATIAYALEHNGTALIDERKATRLCGARFPALPLICTVNILLHPEVQRRLGRARIAEAMFSALTNARMAILPEYVEEVAGLIGPAKIAQCRSLPKSVRQGTG